MEETHIRPRHSHCKRNGRYAADKTGSKAKRDDALNEGLLRRKEHSDRDEIQLV